MEKVIEIIGLMEWIGEMYIPNNHDEFKLVLLKIINEKERVNIFLIFKRINCLMNLI